jgi:hypothetical protein
MFPSWTLLSSSMCGMLHCAPGIVAFCDWLWGALLKCAVEGLCVSLWPKGRKRRSKTCVNACESENSLLHFSQYGWAEEFWIC